MRSSSSTSRMVVWEWPRYNEGWHLPEVRSFWAQIAHIDHNLVDGCMFNLRAQDGNYHKKPWTLRSNRFGVFSKMERLCDGSHKHSPTMGGTVAKKSGLYTPQMCSLAARCMKAYYLEDYNIYGLDSVKIDRESLKTMTYQEIERLSLTVLKLHRRCGHPGNRALVKILAARNADPKMLAIAENLQCDECQEGQFSKPSVAVALEKEEKIWNTLQMDTFYFKHDSNVYHYLVMLDEASGFSITAEILVHVEEIHANVDTQSVIEALEGSWFQCFGHPQRIRCDLEGAFRGRELEAYCAERGIELLQVPAEHHQATGDVERMVGELRHKIELFLRNEDVPPRRAVYAMTTAHNHMARIGGFAPSQWAFGRQMDNLDNIAVHSSEGVSGHAMAENLQLRLRAEKRYLELQANAKISRALNSKTKPSIRFLPGDLVYYKRFKQPSDFPAHQLVDQPRLRISRWYGPGRVLASETRVQEEGTRRVAASTVWVVSQGRLKKFHKDQLRHASERERLIAEQSPAPVTPWTFNALEALIERGAFDDHTADLMDKVPNKSQRRAYNRSRTPVPGGHERRVMAEASSSAPSAPQAVPRDPPDAVMEEPGPTIHALQPLQKIPTCSLWLTGTSSWQTRATCLWSGLVEQNLNLEIWPFRDAANNMRWKTALCMWKRQNLKLQLTGASRRPMAASTVWRYLCRRTRRPGARFWRAHQSLQRRGAEVSWGKLSTEQREAMQAAKNLEVDQWVREEVCKRYRGVIPAGRLMKMRWVLTLKSTDKPETAKCKARIVLLGFTDPNIEDLQTSAPTTLVRVWVISRYDFSYTKSYEKLWSEANINYFVTFL